MADSLNTRPIVVDLAVTGARTIRSAAAGFPEFVKIRSIVVDGDLTAGTVPLVLRQEVAGTGPIVWQFTGTGAAVHDSDHTTITCKGLFLDDVATGWTAGSLIIYIE